jgi:hypothetical protein
MHTRIAVTLLASASLATTGRAQLIQPVSQTRALQSIATVVDSGGGTTQLTDTSAASNFGPYNDQVNTAVALPGPQATASSSAGQTSSILPDSIVADLSFDAQPDVFAAGVSAEASGSSYLDVEFDLNVPTDYTITGSLTQTGGAAVVTLLSGTQAVAQAVSFDGTVPVNLSGSLPFGRYRLTITAAGIATAGTAFDATAGGATIDFSVTSAVPSFCDASDGALASCPCGNPGSPDTGCDNAQGTGGVGLELVAQDTDPVNVATWQATGLPPASTPAVVLLRAGALDASGPVVFCDGLRCIDATVARVTSAFAIGGTATLMHGHSTGPGDYHYQAWYRSQPSSYCTPAAFNLSNGRTLSW